METALPPGVRYAYIEKYGHDRAFALFFDKRRHFWDLTIRLLASIQYRNESRLFCWSLLGRGAKRTNHIPTSYCRRCWVKIGCAIPRWVINWSSSTYSIKRQILDLIEAYLQACCLCYGAQASGCLNWGWSGYSYTRSSWSSKIITTIDRDKYNSYFILKYVINFKKLYACNLVSIRLIYHAVCIFFLYRICWYSHNEAHLSRNQLPQDRAAAPPVSQARNRERQLSTRGLRNLHAGPIVLPKVNGKRPHSPQL